MTKKILAVYIVSTQFLVSIGFLAEYLLRGLNVPIIFSVILALDFIVIFFLKDPSGKRLFASDRLSRFGYIYYFSFDTLKFLEK